MISFFLIMGVLFFYVREARSCAEKAVGMEAAKWNYSLMGGCHIEGIHKNDRSWRGNISRDLFIDAMADFTRR